MKGWNFGSLMGSTIKRIPPLHTHRIVSPRSQASCKEHTDRTLMPQHKVAPCSATAVSMAHLASVTPAMHGGRLGSLGLFVGKGFRSCIRDAVMRLPCSGKGTRLQKFLLGFSSKLRDWHLLDKTPVSVGLASRKPAPSQVGWLSHPPRSPSAGISQLVPLGHLFIADATRDSRVLFIPDRPMFVRHVSP